MSLLARYENIFENANRALLKLEEACRLLETEHASIVGFQAPLVKTNRRGGPYLDVIREQLEYLLQFDFTVPEIARHLSVSVRTVHRRLSEYGLSVQALYSDITSQHLKHIVSSYLETDPNSGYRMVNGYLRSVGIRITDSRLRETMRAVDPFGTLLRGLNLNPIQRRSYSVPAPLSLWHIDGYHKLIRWRFVVHGGIDGYSRKIMYHNASNNNKASAVYQAFSGAVQKFGLPLCVRSDKGGENASVARFMLEHPLCGPGQSVHNQRIERLWRDLWHSVICNYHSTFQYLEAAGVLDPDSDTHLLCLHYVMLPRINAHLDLFRHTWDRHPISSAGNCSPQQLWVSGQLMSGRPPSDPNILVEWGIDWEGPVPTSEPEVEITVPEAPVSQVDSVSGLLRAN